MAGYEAHARYLLCGTAGMRRLLGQIPWPWRMMVAILFPAGIHRHVHRFAPSFGRLEAAGSDYLCTRMKEAVVQLGRAVYLVQFCGSGAKLASFARGSPLLILRVALCFSLSHVLPSSKS